MEPQPFDYADVASIPPRERFMLELEFVQCLADAGYLNFLAQRGYLDEPSFLRFLRYLKYWQKRPYCSYITYPHCLQMLDNLEDAGFRKALKQKTVQLSIEWQQQYFYQYWRANRMRDAEKAKQQLQAGPQNLETEGHAENE